MITGIEYLLNFVSKHVSLASYATYWVLPITVPGWGSSSGSNKFSCSPSPLGVMWRVTGVWLPDHPDYPEEALWTIPEHKDVHWRQSGRKKNNLNDHQQQLALVCLVTIHGMPDLVLQPGTNPGPLQRSRILNHWATT